MMCLAADLLAPDPLNLRNRRPQRAQYLSYLIGALVFTARPEEALQAIALPARNDVHVEMGDALADAIVGGDERSFRPHAQLDRGREHSHIREQRRKERIRQVLDGFEVTLRDEETVARKQGSMVEERDAVLILENAK